MANQININNMSVLELRVLQAQVVRELALRDLQDALTEMSWQETKARMSAIEYRKAVEELNSIGSKIHAGQVTEDLYDSLELVMAVHNLG